LKNGDGKLLKLTMLNHQKPIEIQQDPDLGYSYINDLGLINELQQYLLIGIGDNGNDKFIRK
jgi:hypothetical protein